MKRTIYLETSINGHILEYIHNLYNGYIEKNNEEAIFILPDTFKERKDLFDWKISNNVKIETYSSQKYSYLNKGGIIKGSLYKSLFLRDCVKKFNATNIVLLSFFLYLPFLLIIIPNNVQISGIVYKIFIHNRHCKYKLSSMIEWGRYYMIAKSERIERIYLLNDEKAPEKFNKIFKTSKFFRLPDPYLPVNGNLINIREKFNIRNDQYIFAQVATMEERHGTLEILEAISLVKDKERNVFFFSGIIKKNIKVLFLRRVELLKNSGYKIIVNEGFASYIFLASLCNAADCILVPYHTIDASSGVLGHAAQFNKPVIGPSDGLLGQIIKKYKMGYRLRETNSFEIANAINNFMPYVIPNDYKIDNNIKKFCNTIIG